MFYFVAKYFNLGVGEFILYSSDPEFIGTGSKVDSKVRVTWIATIESRLIIRRLSKLGSGQIQQLNTALIQAFQLS